MYEAGKNPGKAKGLALVKIKNFTDYANNFEKHLDIFILRKMKLQ